jgi:electron transfer flavoprotein alpha/beta subunit
MPLVTQVLNNVDNVSPSALEHAVLLKCNSYEITCVSLIAPLRRRERSDAIAVGTERAAHVPRKSGLMFRAL